MQTGIKIITAVYLGFIFLLVAMADLGLGKPLYELVKTIPGSDKTAHFLLMGFISFLVHLAMKNPIIRIFKLPFLKGSLIILPIILLEELSQFYFSYRNCSSLDFASDVFGVFIFGYIAVLYQVKNKKKENHAKE